MSQLRFCRIKVNSPSPLTYAHALEKRVPFPLCWGSQLLFPSLFLPDFQGFNLLWQLLAPVLISIFPLKKTKKRNAFSSKQLNPYSPISQAVIIHFTGVLLKKEKNKKKKKKVLKTHFALIISLFPASVLLMHIHPFLAPQILQKPLIPKSPSVFPSNASLAMCPRCLGENSQLQQLGVSNPAKARLGLDTRQARSAQGN